MFQTWRDLVGSSLDGLKYILSKRSIASCLRSVTWGVTKRKWFMSWEEPRWMSNMLVYHIDIHGRGIRSTDSLELSLGCISGSGLWTANWIISICGSKPSQVKSHLFQFVEARWSSWYFHWIDAKCRCRGMLEFWLWFPPVWRLEGKGLKPKSRTMRTLLYRNWQD